MSDFFQWAMIVCAIASVPIYALIREKTPPKLSTHELEEQVKKHKISLTDVHVFETYPPYRGAFDAKPLIGLDAEYPHVGPIEYSFGYAKKTMSGSSEKYGEALKGQRESAGTHVRSQLPN